MIHQETTLQRTSVITAVKTFLVTLFRRKWVGLLIFSTLLLFVVIRPFVLRSYVIPSGSMMNTLLPGDRVLVCKFLYGVRMPYFRWKLLPVHRPQHGDICVAHLTKGSPGHEKPFDIIKRVVGLPGDVIEIQAGQLSRNGELLDEPYAQYIRVEQHQDHRRDYFRRYQVPKDHVFLIGDNRDATWLGMVPVKNLVGPAVLIYWSWDARADSWRRIRLGRIGWL